MYSIAYLQMLLIKQLQIYPFANFPPQILKILGIGAYDFHQG